MSFLHLAVRNFRHGDRFSDCEIINLEEDYYSPGVFLKVKKPNDFAERDLSKLELYNIAINTQALEFTIADLSMKPTVELEMYHQVRLERHVTRAYDTFVATVFKFDRLLTGHAVISQVRKTRDKIFQSRRDATQTLGNQRNLMEKTTIDGQGDAF